MRPIVTDRVVWSRCRLGWGLRWELCIR